MSHNGGMGSLIYSVVVEIAVIKNKRHMPMMGILIGVIKIVGNLFYLCFYCC